MWNAITSLMRSKRSGGENEIYYEKRIDYK